MVFFADLLISAVDISHDPCLQKSLDTCVQLVKLYFALGSAPFCQDSIRGLINGQNSTPPECLATSISKNGRVLYR